MTNTTPHPADALPLPDLSEERINNIADLTVKGMPDGIRGFCVTWGWQQFARALLENFDNTIRAAHREGYELAMSTRADLLAEAHAQIRHLIDDLTTAVDDDGLTRYVPPAANSLVYSNMIGALIPLATRMAEALASQPAQEQVNAQGKTNAALDTDSNTSESKQQRHMAGSLEVGQLVGERQDSRSGDIEPQGAQSLERWLCGILKPIAEDIAKNCSTVPQLVIAPLIWGISDLLKSGALCTSPPPKSDEARDAEREPVARVELMTTGGNAGIATRIVEIDDPLRERLSPGALLYDYPPPKSDEARDAYLSGELELVLTDKDTKLSNGAARTIRYVVAALAAQQKGGA